MCSCESDQKFTFEHLSNKHNIFSLYYRKLSANSPKGYLPATDDNSNCDERKILVFALFCVNKT